MHKQLYLIVTSFFTQWSLDLPKLESLIFDCEVFKYTSNFTMTSNHYLCKSIIDLPSLNSFFLNSFSLENIQSISISGFSYWWMIYQIDLPKLKTLRTRNNGFYKTESITLSSIIDTIWIMYIFLLLQLFILKIKQCIQLKQWLYLVLFQY